MTCVHIVKDGTLSIFGKKFGCDMLIFVSFYTPLNMEENKVHFRYLISFTGKAKMPHKRQTRYALFMAKVL